MFSIAVTAQVRNDMADGIIASRAPQAACRRRRTAYSAISRFPSEACIRAIRPAEDTHFLSVPKEGGMFSILAVKTARTQDTRLHLARFVGEPKRVVPLTIIRIAVGRQRKA